MIFQCLLCIQVSINFFPLVVHAKRQCVNLNEEQPILVY